MRIHLVWSPRRVTLAAGKEEARRRAKTIQSSVSVRSTRDDIGRLCPTSALPSPNGQFFSLVPPGHIEDIRDAAVSSDGATAALVDENTSSFVGS